MSSEQLIVQEDGFVATLIINRPEKRNMLSPSLFQDLIDAIDRLTRENKVRVLVLTGAGEKAFSAGFDISEIPSSGGGKETQSDGVLIIEKAFAAVRECKIPTIAMINGYAVGAGLDLCVNCDFRICRSGSKLGITPARLGLVYFYSGIQRFLNLIGPSATKYLFYTGRLIESEVARQLGLVDFVVSPEELQPYTYNLAREIAEDSAPIAVQGMKYMINTLSAKAAITAGEEEKFAQLMFDAISSKDMLEGQVAFMEKRKPVFTGE